MSTYSYDILRHILWPTFVKVVWSDVVTQVDRVVWNKSFESVYEPLENSLFNSLRSQLTHEIKKELK